MKYRQLIGWLCVAAVGCAPLPPAQSLESLVENYIRAVNHNDQRAYLRTMHPEVRRAMKDALPEFFTQLVARDLQKKIPEDYKLTIHEIKPEDPLLFEGAMQYLIRPTHRVEMDYETGAHSSTSVMLQAKEEQGQWYFVYPIPTAETKQKMKEAAKQAVARKQQVSELVASLSPEEKREITDRVVQGQKIQVIKDFRARHEVGLAVAGAVVDRVLYED